MLEGIAMGMLAVLVVSPSAIVGETALAIAVAVGAVGMLALAAGLLTGRSARYSGALGGVGVLVAGGSWWLVDGFPVVPVTVGVIALAASALGSTLSTNS